MHMTDVCIDFIGVPILISRPDDPTDVFAYVSACDYEWAVQWMWRVKLDKRGRKIYAVRHGRRDGKQVDFYLHKDILSIRMKAVPPSEAHVIGEHEDGDSLNNVRTNLSWITRSHNCKTAKVKTPRHPVTGRFHAVLTPEPAASYCPWCRLVHAGMCERLIGGGQCD